MLELEQDVTTCQLKAVKMTPVDWYAPCLYRESQEYMQEVSCTPFKGSYAPKQIAHTETCTQGHTDIVACMACMEPIRS